MRAVEAAAADSPGPGAALVGGLLREIAELLAGLAERGEPGAIDLRSLPLAPADLEELETRLGRGDVSARLDAAGTSEIWETRYRGVWWVRHFGGDGRIALERIEIAAIPEILLAADADLAAAAASLRADLAPAAAASFTEAGNHVGL